MPKYPHVTVVLNGRDGNAFAILGQVDQALRAGMVPAPEREAFRQGGHGRKLRPPAEGRDGDGRGRVRPETKKAPLGVPSSGAFSCSEGGGPPSDLVTDPADDRR
jgi:hypothetical protein